MAVRAKMTCSAITLSQSGREVKLLPVGGDTPENKTWSQYTPSGQITMFVTNPAAYEQFELGKSYYVDFTEATA